MSILIERVQARITELAEQRDAVNAELSDIASNPEARGFESDDAGFARIAELRAEGEKIAKEITDAEDRVAQLVADEERAAAAAPARPLNVGGAIVRNEAKTYSAENREVSFFADAYRAERTHDADAQERIQRHMREVQVERRDITSSTLNGLVPPLYLLDQAATLARAMRPFANVLPSYQLPANGMSVVVTKVTTGTATAAQTSQNTAAHEVDMVTTDVTIPVVSIMGQQDVSRQAIERGAVTDSLIFSDLIADYATRLDAQVLSGSGTNGQHKGILTITAGTDSYAGTTVAAFYGSVNAALARVAGARFAPATVIVMHPRRWHWLLSKSDTTGRPFVVPAAPVASNPVGIGQTEGTGIAGTLAGLPVVVDANVPTNLGASTDEDRVIVTRLSDHALWEAGLVTFSFDQSVNAPATIRLAVAGYSAFTAERYTSATSVVLGTGLVAPTYG
jgi:HK97 family phage major capsid protein